MKPYVPLGILYICCICAPKEFGVEVFDTTFSMSPRFVSAYLRKRTASGARHLRQPDDTAGNVIEILQVAREPDGRPSSEAPSPGSISKSTCRPERNRRNRRRRSHDGGTTPTPCAPVTQSSYADSCRPCIRSSDGTALHHTAPGRPQITNLDSQPWPARGS